MVFGGDEDLDGFGGRGGEVGEVEMREVRSAATRVRLDWRERRSCLFVFEALIAGRLKREGREGVD